MPFEETCSEIDKLYKEGKFEQFGLSNFAAWEVAEVVMTCRAKGFVQPRIYQGECADRTKVRLEADHRLRCLEAMYNAITRSAEEELLPACRKYGLRIVVYTPLAGGFFAGKITSNDTSSVEPGSRFDKSSRVGQMYVQRYVNDGYLRALNHIKPVVEKNGLRLTETALRWMQHHSKLDEKDGVIIGASSLQQVSAGPEGLAAFPSMPNTRISLA